VGGVTTFVLQLGVYDGGGRFANGELHSDFENAMAHKVLNGREDESRERRVVCGS